MRGWMMPPHRGMSSRLISGAATHGVPPMLSPLTKHPKPMLSFPLPAINSSTFFFFNYYCSTWFFFHNEGLGGAFLAALGTQTQQYRLQSRSSRN